MTMETAVTHSVPAMKGKKPKAPLRGCQVVENNSAPSGLVEKMGQTRIRSAKAISGTNTK